MVDPIEVVAGDDHNMDVAGIPHLGKDLAHADDDGGLAGGVAQPVQQPEVVHEQLYTGIRMIGGESSQDTGTRLDGVGRCGTYTHRRFC